MACYVDLRDLGVSIDSSDETFIQEEDDDDALGWYWGQLTKAEVNEQLQDRPDGSFLVRDGAEPGYFTLTIKKGGVNKLVKIYCRNDMYGFSEPFTFHSLEELISYFQTHSLSTHNSSLDIKLLYPVVKAKRDSYGDDAKKKRDYRELIEKLRVEECKLEKMYERQSEIQYNLQGQEKIAESFSATISIYEQQVKLHRQFHGHVSSVDIGSVRENYNALIARLEEISAMREEIVEDIGSKTMDIRYLNWEISEIKPEIRRLARAKTKRKRWLVDMNLLPHAVEDTWNVGLCDRRQAISMLDGREPGTFLVRKSEKDDTESYAISMMSDKNIVHIKILYYEETGYGIAEGFCDHPTLMDLILHYEEVPMSEHNSTIRLNLKYPVRGSHIDDFYESEPIYGI